MKSIAIAARAVTFAVLIVLAVSCSNVRPESTTSDGRLLRVCADPNNLPFSNERGEGFENRIAELLARDLNAKLEYTWWAQRRGYVRNTIRAGTCEVWMGVPAGFEMTAVTAPYYRSSYVFVQRQDSPFDLRSMDAPELRTLRVGVQIVGDDYANAPPAHALARRGIVQNVVGFRVTDDYTQPNPPARVVEAVARGEIDVAIAWGPMAGYFARRQHPQLRVTPISTTTDLPSLPLVFDIAMGVRRGNEQLRSELDSFLIRRRDEIRKILSDFGVPQLSLEGA